MNEITTTQLIKRMGKNAVYEEPSEKIIQAVNDFITDLFNKKDLKEHLRILNLDQLEIIDLPGSFAYVPKDFKTPVLNQIFVLWNTQQETFNFIGSYQHSGTDNVDKLAIEYFKLGIKCMVCNGIQPRTEQRSKIQPKRSASDGCHSYQVLGPNVIKQLEKLDPTFGIISIHGCLSSKPFDIWFSNSCAKKFNRTRPNFAFELLNAYLSNKTNKVQTNDPTYKNLPQVIYKHYLPTSDVPMNIFNPDRKDSGRAVHIEHTITMHSKQKEINDLMKVVKISMINYELKLYKSSKGIDVYENWPDPESDPESDPEPQESDSEFD